MFFKLAQKSPNIWSNTCHVELLKTAQYGHTDGHSSKCATSGTTVVTMSKAEFILRANILYPFENAWIFCFKFIQRMFSVGMTWQTWKELVQVFFINFVAW